MKHEMTIQDLCQMEGAIIVLQRYAHHLRQNMRRLVCNYEATDGDTVAILADAAYAQQNASVVIETATYITDAIKKLRAEIAPTFANQENEEEQ